MNNKRSLLTFTGGACILLGVFILVAIIARFIGLGLDLVKKTGDSPDAVFKLFLNGWYQTALAIELLTYLILVPALIGLYYFLKRTANGYALVGLVFGGIAFMLYLFSQLIEAGLILWLTKIGLEQSYSIKNDAFLVYRLSWFFSGPAVIPYVLFFYFWGTALKRFDGNARLVGILFLSEILLIIVTAILNQLSWTQVASVGIILQALVLAASYILAGQVVFTTGKEEPASL